jgi:hypothetical protein
MSQAAVDFISSTSKIGVHESPLESHGTALVIWVQGYIIYMTVPEYAAP